MGYVMKKSVLLAVLTVFVVIFIFSLSSCGEETPKVTDVTVPEWAGQSFEGDISKFFEDSEVYELHLEYDSDGAASDGIVVSQTPAAGETIQVNDEEKIDVYLVVAASDGRIVVPDFTNENARKAEIKLRGLRANYRIEYMADDEIDKDNVIKTEPVFGETLMPDEELIIYVSSGPVES